MIPVIILASLLVAFLSSGVESALLTISRVRIRHLAESGDHAAARLLTLLEHRVELLHCVTALNHGTALLGYLLCVRELVQALGIWGWLVALVGLTPLFLVLLELLPKQLFHRYPLGLLRTLTKSLAVLLRLARPWLWLAHLFQSRMLNDVPEEKDQRSMASLTKSIETLNVLRPAVGAVLHKAGRLQEVDARTVMMPLKQVTALAPDMPLASALVLCREQHHAWRPVMGGDGSLLGWLDVATLPPRIHPDKLVRQFMRPLSQLRDHEPALRCLQTLRKRGEPVAAVVDETGEAVGVITQQALLNVMLSPKPNGQSSA